MTIKQSIFRIVKICFYSLVILSAPLLSYPNNAQAGFGADPEGEFAGAPPSFPLSDYDTPGICCLAGHSDLHDQTRDHFWNPETGAIDSEMERTQDWMVNIYFRQHILPAMQRMTDQLTNVAMQQVAMFGMMLDAKHQLESQRIFQQLQAEAHKDYHPSEGLCTIGTGVRSLAASARYAEYNREVLENRFMERILSTGDTSSREGASSDMRTKMAQYIDVYCDQRDNNNGLDETCINQARTGAARFNGDLKLHEMLYGSETIGINHTPGFGGDTGLNAGTFDEEDSMAMIAHIIKQPLPLIDNSKISNETTTRFQGDTLLLANRNLAAKLNVAASPVLNIIGMRSTGSGEAAPFIRAHLEEQGLSEEEITARIGANPSYYSQLSTLATMGKNPNSFASLYDKPTNVRRMGVAQQAIEMMVDREIYESLLRQELVLATHLAEQINTEQERVNSEIQSIVRAAADGTGN